MTSALGFKARVDSFTSMICYLHTTDSSDSSLVQHLLTSWWPAWSLSCFDPHTCIQALLGLESRIERATISQHVTRQALYRLKSVWSKFINETCVFQSGSSFVIDTGKISDQGLYQCTVTNPHGTTLSKIVEVSRMCEYT